MYSSQSGFLARRAAVWACGLALVAAGCGSSDQNSSESIADTASSTTASSSPVEPRTVAECVAETRDAVGVLQEFIDEYEQLTVAEWNALDPQPDLVVLQENLLSELTVIVESGCDPEVVDAATGEQVESLSGEGELGLALVAALRGEQAPAGPPSPDQRDDRESEPSTVSVRSVDELVDALARVAPLSRIDVLAGEYDLAEPLVVDVAVEIVGAGRQETVLRSSAEGNAFVFLGPGPLTIRSLTMESVADVPATVFVSLVGGVALRDVRVQGGKSAPDGAIGGHGVVFAFESIEGIDDRTPEELAGDLIVEDSEISDNDGAGVLMAGPSAPLIVGNEIRRNGRCGVCSNDDSSGTIRANVLEENGIGLLVVDLASPIIEGNEQLRSTTGGAVVQDAATPVLKENTFRDDLGIGVQVLGTAVPVVEANRIISADSVGMVFAEQAGGTVRGNTIEGPGTAGILISGNALPDLRSNTIRAGAAGLVYTEQGSGQATQNDIQQTEIGIQVTGSATPTLERNAIEESRDAAALYGGTAGGRFELNTVTGSSSFGVQIGESAAPIVTGNSFDDVAVASIVVVDDGGGEISGNVCPAEAGIAVAATATAEIGENECDVAEV